MANANILNCAIQSYKDYWEFLGTMRGITDITGKICRLEGDINYTYLVNLDETALENDLDDIIEKIKSKEIGNEFKIIPELYSPGIVDKIIKARPFRELGCSFGMAKNLACEIYEKQNDKNIDVFRVNDIGQLKFCGAILNACFEYDIFSFSHYLDAFNNHKIRFYFAEYKGIPVSSCMAMYDEEYVEIVWVGTIPRYRKKGIASRLIIQAETDAIERNKKFAVLTALPEAKSTYEKLNYKQYYKSLGLAYQPE